MHVFGCRCGSRRDSEEGCGKRAGFPELRGDGSPADRVTEPNNLRPCPGMHNQSLPLQIRWRRFIQPDALTFPKLLRFPRGRLRPPLRLPYPPSAGETIVFRVMASHNRDKTRFLWPCLRLFLGENLAFAIDSLSQLFLWPTTLRSPLTCSRKKNRRHFTPRSLFVGYVPSPRTSLAVAMPFENAPDRGRRGAVPGLTWSHGFNYILRVRPVLQRLLPKDHIPNNHLTYINISYS